MPLRLEMPQKKVQQQPLVFCESNEALSLGKFGSGTFKTHFVLDSTLTFSGTSNLTFFYHSTQLFSESAWSNFEQTSFKIIRSSENIMSRNWKWLASGLIKLEKRFIHRANICRLESWKLQEGVDFFGGKLLRMGRIKGVDGSFGRED